MIVLDASATKSPRPRIWPREVWNHAHWIDMQGVCEPLATPWQNNWSLPGGMLEQNEASCKAIALHSARAFGSVTLLQFDMEPLLETP